MDMLADFRYRGVMQESAPATGPGDRAMLAEIRAAASETLAVWPEARAALLFGSRARGDHRPDSDWDVAFVLSGPGDGVQALPEDLPIYRFPGAVQCLAVPEELLRRKAGAIGHIARGIARDGRLLAGTCEGWRSPGTSPGQASVDSAAGTPWIQQPFWETPHMQAEEYGRFMRNAATYMAAAADSISRIGRMDWEDDATACNHFAARSADAAEHLAKAMLGREGVEFKFTHNLSALARQAAHAGLHELARTVGLMNGGSREDHKASYAPVDADSCAHAVRRMILMTGELAEELDRVCADPVLADAAARLRNTVLNWVRESCAALAPDRLVDPDPATLPEGERARIAVLIEARPVLAEALERLEERLSKGPGHDSIPGPGC